MVSENDFFSGLLDDLNAEQRAAVIYPAQSVLVLAGAGSGKTRVLTTRMAWLLGQADIQPQNILAVTFTNKAAKEMTERLNAMMPNKIKGIWLGTFHGLCHRLLRIHHQQAQLPATFQIVDTNEQLSLLKRVLPQNTAIEAQELRHFIQSHKENGLRAKALTATEPNQQLWINYYEQYEQLCEQEGLVDFDELLLRSIELLDNHPDLLAYYQQRFRHILVDEFQDTNILQYQWLKRLVGEKTAVFAVGDDDQSIYRFRGARVGNMIDFMCDFHVSSAIRLEQNYRSTGNILAAANAVIVHNHERLGKNLRTDAGAGDKIHLLKAWDDVDEARLLVNEIRALQKKSYPFEQMAVFYRNNAQSRVLEHVLFQNHIPYQIYGGLRFYERMEIKNVLAFLRLLINPDDNHAFLRIINTPPRGIGERTLSTIQATATQQNASLFHAARVLAKQSSKIGAFVDLMEGLYHQMDTVSLPDLLMHIIHDTGLYAYYQKHTNPVEKERNQNLMELVNAAHDFRVNPDETSALDSPQRNVVLAFLNESVLASGENPHHHGGDAVQLMTVHAAKGLEFEAVFLTGMEEGRFPSERSLQESGGLEEERRLMYVAMTRAKKHLYISMAAQRVLYGKKQLGILSRFVEDIPVTLLHGQATPQRDLDDYRHLHFESENDLSENNQYFKIGNTVRHSKWGEGTVMAVVNRKHGVFLTIDFGEKGVKELGAAFTNFEKVT